MQQVRNELNECKQLKKQADALSSWDMAKKLELADKAIVKSFSVIESLVDKVEELDNQIKGAA
ncbi:hypothetical protein JL49_09080 [Pseudoalteromonas luteoviolacea]|nr:hypothetical protein JL49_09080 [Pseudoalteromonas luteoviolacea]